MAATAPSNIVIPENFAAYVAQNSTVKTPLWLSNVIGNAPNVQITKGGRTVNMPFLNDLTGDAEILSASVPLTVNNVTAAKQTAVVHTRGKAFGVNDLSSTFAGTNITDHIAGRMAAFWNRVFQKQVVANLNGAIANTAFAATNVLDISGLANAAAVFSTEAFIDAEHKLGDSRSSLAAFAVHSDVVAKMKKLNLTEQQQDSLGGNITVYRGYQLLEMDSLTANAGVYTGFLLGRNAFGFSDGNGLHQYETDRDIKAGDDIITARRHYALHLNGLSWKGTPAGETPTDAELATGSNWEVALDPKNIPVVGFKFKLS